MIFLVQEKAICRKPTKAEMLFLAEILLGQMYCLRIDTVRTEMPFGQKCCLAEMLLR